MIRESDRESAAAPPLSGDLAAIKNAIDLARKAKTGEATVIGQTIGDPAAQKLVEWYILRHPAADAKFSRLVMIEQKDKTILSLEAQLDCLGGVTDTVVKQYINRFEEEAKRFSKFPAK